MDEAWTRTGSWVPSWVDRVVGAVLDLAQDVPERHTASPVTALRPPRGDPGSAMSGVSHGSRASQIDIVVDSTCGVVVKEYFEVVRVHPIKHDRSREAGAFSNPGGRAQRTNTA